MIPRLCEGRNDAEDDEHTCRPVTERSRGKKFEN